MNSEHPERIRTPVPAGLLLLGPAGTGKTSVAHLIATQTDRSFYPISPADVATPDKLQQIFARARENSPSILFIDEMDAVLTAAGNNKYVMTQYQEQIVDQALTLMSPLDAGNRVFLIGTTNHIDDIDRRVLRGRRFSSVFRV